jgi:PIN domain
MPSKALVVDANILVRAVLGKRAREVIETYADEVSFFVPDVALAEAEEHLPALVIKHGGDPERALGFLRTKPLWTGPCDDNVGTAEFRIPRHPGITWLTELYN